MSPRGIIFEFNSTMPGTWVGHGSLCLALLVVGAVIGGFCGDALYGGLIGASAGLLFYVRREEHDKAIHIQEGKYDERARLDKVGDTLASAFVYATALAMYISGLP